MSENALANAIKPENKIEKKSFHKHEIGISQSNDFPAEQILFLQRTIGNQAVDKLIRSGTLQAKLSIERPLYKTDKRAEEKLVLI